MITSKPSPLWYRVANLKTKLRDHVDLHRHQYRGKRWYVVHDRASHRYYRFGPGAYQLIRQLNGQCTIQEIWEDISAAGHKDSPTQDEIIRLLSSLHSNDLIQGNVAPDSNEQFARYKRALGSKFTQHIKGPLLIRLPLADPDVFLNRLSGISALVFSSAGLFVWLLLVSIAAFLSASHLADFSQYWEARALAPYNLLLMLLIYPVIKGLHELAHGVAVKRWGGEVHEVGVMLLVFMPLPYIDASSSIVFRDKHKRMLVGAAGILAELFMAAIASLVWLTVETGIVRDIAFNTMLIGGISTLLFNGNPLLKFDGYYVLADALEIPNLAQRSNRYYAYLIQRYLFAIGHLKSPVSEQGERYWFLFYGPASCIYRLAILLTIALFLSEKYLIIGVILALLAVLLQVVIPVARQLQFVINSPAVKNRRLRAVASLMGLIGAIIVVLVYAPMPSSTYAQGIVWLPENALVRANTDGFIAEFLSSPQTTVSTGMPLLQFENSLLEFDLESRKWELRELNARFNQQLLSDRAEASILQGQVERLTAEFTQLQQRASELTVVSPSTGTFLVAGARHLLGRYSHKGEVLGFVTDHSNLTVRTVVQQTDIDWIRSHTNSIKVRLADHPGETFEAEIQQQTPSATDQLPSEALGSQGGGLVTVDPNDPSGITASEKVFLVDITLPPDSGVQRVGTRAHIRFEHDSIPIAKRLYRQVRQLLLRRFTV